MSYVIHDAFIPLNEFFNKNFAGQTASQKTQLKKSFIEMGILMKLGTKEFIDVIRHAEITEREIDLRFKKRDGR